MDLDTGSTRDLISLKDIARIRYPDGEIPLRGPPCRGEEEEKGRDHCRESYQPVQ